MSISNIEDKNYQARLYDIDGESKIIKSEEVYSQLKLTGNWFDNQYEPLWRKYLYHPSINLQTAACLLQCTNPVLLEMCGEKQKRLIKETEQWLSSCIAAGKLTVRKNDFGFSFPPFDFLLFIKNENIKYQRYKNYIHPILDNLINLLKTEIEKQADEKFKKHKKNIEETDEERENRLEILIKNKKYITLTEALNQLFYKLDRYVVTFKVPANLGDKEYGEMTNAEREVFDLYCQDSNLKIKFRDLALDAIKIGHLKTQNKGIVSNKNQYIVNLIELLVWANENQLLPEEIKEIKIVKGKIDEHLLNENLITQDKKNSFLINKEEKQISASYINMQEDIKKIKELSEKKEQEDEKRRKSSHEDGKTISFIQKKYYGLEEAQRILQQSGIVATPYDIATFALEHSFDVLFHLNSRDVHACQINLTDEETIVNVIGRCSLNAYFKYNNILPVIQTIKKVGSFKIPLYKNEANKTKVVLLYHDDIIGEPNLSSWTIQPEAFSCPTNVIKLQNYEKNLRVDCYHVISTNGGSNQIFYMSNIVITHDCLQQLLSNSFSNTVIKDSAMIKQKIDYKAHLSLLEEYQEIFLSGLKSPLKIPCRVTEWVKEKTPIYPQLKLILTELEKEFIISWQGYLYPNMDDLLDMQKYKERSMLMKDYQKNQANKHSSHAETETSSIQERIAKKLNNAENYPHHDAFAKYLSYQMKVVKETGRLNKNVADIFRAAKLELSDFPNDAHNSPKALEELLKSEEQKKIEALAKGKLKDNEIKKQNAAEGTKAVKDKKQKWLKPALSIYERIKEQHPRFSQEQIAKKIKKELQKESINCPKPKRIAEAIRNERKK